MEDKKYEISRDELEQLSNMAQCGMFIATATGGMELIYGNPRLYSMIQYTPEELKEKYSNRLFDLVDENEKQKLKNIVARQLAFGGVLQLEVRIAKGDGTNAWIAMSARSAFEEGKHLYYGTCVDITESKRQLSEVYQAKHEAELIANSIPGGVIKIRMSDFTLLYANDGFYRLAGYTKEEYKINFGDHCDHVIHPDDQETVMNHVKMAVSNGGMLGFEYRIIAKNGDVRWTYVNGCRTDDDEGEPVYLCILMDITKRKQLEQSFEESALRSKLLSRMMEETYWTYNLERDMMYRDGDLSITYSDDYKIQNFLSEEYFQQIFHHDEWEKAFADFNYATKHCTKQKNQYQIRTVEGGFRKMEVSYISVNTTGGDVPDRIFGNTKLSKEMAADIELEATGGALEESVYTSWAKKSTESMKDEITGMIPYATFLRKAQDIINEKNNEKYYVLCADIDEFKKFRYSYGFSVSNDILKNYSEVLKKFVGDEGICSRVAGDYFVAFFSAKSSSGLELAERIEKMFQYQQQTEGDNLSVTYETTIGLCEVGDNDVELSILLERADLARRNLKGVKGNHYGKYSDEMRQEGLKEEQIIQEIWEAMKNQQVEMCYLPRVKDNKENVIFCKAVPRVLLKDGRYIESEELQRYIERSETLQKYSFAMLNKICINVGAYKVDGYKIIPIAMELTAGQLCQVNAVQTIDDIVRKNGLDPSEVSFEIHEKYCFEMTNALRTAIEDLSGRGYSVVISRFASHHTALHTLRELPITGVKFHAEYFAESMRNERDKRILSGIVDTAKSIGLDVYCGSVHTELQEQYAKDIGCEAFEGELYYGIMRGTVFTKCFLKK